MSKLFTSGKQMLNSKTDKELSESKMLPAIYYDNPTKQHDSFRHVIDAELLEENAKVTTGTISLEKERLPRIQSKEYYFMGSMSQELLNKYLDKSLFIMGYSDPENFNGKLKTHEKSALLALIKDIRPKMIAIAGTWSIGDNHSLGWLRHQTQKDIEEIHAFDPDIICGGAVFEIFHKIYPGEITIPDFVLTEFGFSVTGTGSSRHRNHLGVISHAFDVKLMRYTSAADRIDFGGENGEITPDITKVESQMWLYFMSTLFIDAGCELLSLGDMFVIAGIDRKAGYGSLWMLMQKIRKYGSTRNRGIVLIEGRYYVNDTIRNAQVYYYDPNPHHPLIGKPERQLLYDFISSGVPVAQIAGLKITGGGVYVSPIPCTPDYAPVKLIKTHLLGASPGGLSPLGWITKHCPSRLQFDQGGGTYTPFGCGVGEFGTLSAFRNYGWDPASWFAAQSEYYRNLLLKYLYYHIKCLDRNAHLIFIARTTVRVDNKEDKMYHAYTGSANQQETMKCIWSGAYATPFEWTPHNFTEEKVFNGLNNSASSLIFVGTDKIYFIGTDGYIHGWVLYRGAWLGVSPTHAASMKYGHTLSGIKGQVKAKSNLVASPDGKMLLYIGVDNYIHGFKILDIWDYYHVQNFMKSEMRGQFIIAENSLIFPANDKIYYIARQVDGTLRVHGFQSPYGSGGPWLTVSPSYSAQFTHGQSVSSQFQAGGALTYHATSSTGFDRIYYRTTNGYLAYFEVRSRTDYYYVPCPGNFKLSAQGLKIVGNLAIYANRIYYIAIYGNNPALTDSYRIHCLIDDGGGIWNTISPTYEAKHAGQPLNIQARSNANGLIAVNGNTIAYFSEENKVCLYIENGGDSFKFLNTEISDDCYGHNSLQFIQGTQLFYVRRTFSRSHRGRLIPMLGDTVSQLVFEENFCKNPSITEMPFILRPYVPV
jgi:hypothetical protein